MLGFRNILLQKIGDLTWRWTEICFSTLYVRSTTCTELIPCSPGSRNLVWNQNLSLFAMNLSYYLTGPHKRIIARPKDLRVPLEQVRFLQYFDGKSTRFLSSRAFERLIATHPRSIWLSLNARWTLPPPPPPLSPIWNTFSPSIF